MGGKFNSIFIRLLGSGAGRTAAPSADYDSWTVPELKAELKRRGEKSSGRKAELLARLRAPAPADEAAAGAAGAPTDGEGGASARDAPDSVCAEKENDACLVSHAGEVTGFLLKIFDCAN